MKIARCLLLAGGRALIGVSFFLMVDDVRIEESYRNMYTYEWFLRKSCLDNVAKRFLLRAELKKYFPVAQPIFLRAVQQAWSHFWVRA